MDKKFLTPIRPSGKGGMKEIWDFFFFLQTNNNDDKKEKKSKRMNDVVSLVVETNKKDAPSDLPFVYQSTFQFGEGVR